MQVIVDGIYVESDYLTMMNPLDISSIEVLRSGGNTAIYGSRGGAGVIIVNTKRGNEVSDNQYQRYTPGLVRYSPKGFYKARTFYSSPSMLILKLMRLWQICAVLFTGTQV